MLGALSSDGLVLYRVFSDSGDVLRAGILIGVGILLYELNRAVSGRVETFDAEKAEKLEA